VGNALVFLVMAIAVCFALGWTKATERLMILFLLVFFTYAALLTVGR
jgi:hypothetical protein